MTLVFLKFRVLLKGNVNFGVLIFSLYGGFAVSYSHQVMELCAGGDLDKHMQKQNAPYTERQAVISSALDLTEASLQAGILMEQILNAVSYLHDCKGVCATALWMRRPATRRGHRDLKPQNFLFLREARPISVVFSEVRRRWRAMCALPLKSNSPKAS